MQQDSSVASPPDHQTFDSGIPSGPLSVSRRKQTPRRATPKSRSRGVSSSGAGAPTAGALSRYLGELGRHATFTREQEIEAANDIASREIAFWTLMLACPAALASCEASLLSTLTNAEQGAQSQGVDLLSQLLSTESHASSLEINSKSALGAEQTDVLTRLLRERDKDRSTLREVYDATLQWCDWAKTSAQPEMQQRAGQHERSVRRAFRRQNAAKQRFAAANLRLVVAMAKRYNRGALPLADLIQEGNMGLMTAIERFDPEQGCRFSTYAGWWIRHAVSRAIADKSRTVRIPVHRQELRQRVARLERKSLSRFGRTPTLDELMQQTGASERTLRLVVDQPQQRSLPLDRKIGDDEGLAFVDLLVDESTPAPDEALASDQWKVLLGRHLSELRPIESHILRWRFGLDGAEERTLKQLGDELSLSRERVRQLQNRALGRLRQRLDAQDAALAPEAEAC